MNGSHLNSAWISDLKYFQTMILTPDGMIQLLFLVFLLDLECLSLGLHIHHCLFERP